MQRAGVAAARCLARASASGRASRAAGAASSLRGRRDRAGRLLQQAVDANPEGTTFCLKSGIHRLATAVPRSGQRFVGEGAETVLWGARILDAAAAQRDGEGRFYWDGQTQTSVPNGRLVPPGRVNRPNVGDLYNEELFVTRSGDPRDPRGGTCA